MSQPGNEPWAMPNRFKEALVYKGMIYEPSNPARELYTSYFWWHGSTYRSKLFHTTKITAPHKVIAMGDLFDESDLQDWWTLAAGGWIERNLRAGKDVDLFDGELQKDTNHHLAMQLLEGRWREKVGLGAPIDESELREVVSFVRGIAGIEEVYLTGSLSLNLVGLLDRQAEDIDLWVKMVNSEEAKKITKRITSALGAEAVTKGVHLWDTKYESDDSFDLIQFTYKETKIDLFCFNRLPQLTPIHYGGVQVMSVLDTLSFKASYPNLKWFRDWNFISNFIQFSKY